MNEELKKKIHDLLNLERNPVCHGWCTPEKACVLADLIIEKNISTVVEVGIFGGRSIIPMAMAIKEKGLGHVWGVDPWIMEAVFEGDNGKENDEWWGQQDLDQIYQGFVEEVFRSGVGRECRWLRCRGEEATKFFADGSIQLFHLDSNHSELASCRDVELWHRKLAPKSFWVLDDADWPTQQKAIGLIKDKGFSIYHHYGNYIIFAR